MVDVKARDAELRWLWVWIGAGLALRLLALASFAHEPVSDELAYQAMARNLVAGHGVIDSDGNRAMYNVGYPLFILAPLFAVFGDGLIAPRLAHALLGGLTIFLCWGLAAEAGAGARGRLWAAAFAALYLPFSVYAVYLFKENLMTPLMVGALWLALRYRRSAATKIAAAIGAVMGLLALTGNAALCLLAPIALAIPFRAIGLRRAGAAIAAGLLVGAAIVAPWLVRNTMAVGAPVLNTNGGFNLYLGNNPSANGMFVSIADTPRGATWPDLRRHGEVFASSVLRDDAVKWIGENRAKFAELALLKAVYFWTPPLHAGQGQPSRAETLVRSAWALEFVVLCLLALSGLAQKPLLHRGTAVLWAVLVCYTGVHMLFYVAFRYREPVMPIVCVLAALSLERIWTRLRSR